MPHSGKFRMLKMVPIDTDGEMLPQLVASLERLYTGVSDIGESVAAVLDRPARPLKMSLSDSDLAIVAKLQQQYRESLGARDYWCTVSRDELGIVLNLIDDARKR